MNTTKQTAWDARVRARCMAILRAVCVDLGVAEDVVLAGMRGGSVDRARALAFYAARKATRYSYPELGRAFGGRDHSTIMSACKRAARLVRADELAAQAVDVAVLADAAEHATRLARCRRAVVSPSLPDGPVHAREAADGRDILVSRELWAALQAGALAG